MKLGDKVSYKGDELFAVELESGQVLLVPRVEVEQSEHDDLPAPSITLSEIHDREHSVDAISDSALAAHK